MNRYRSAVLSGVFVSARRAMVLTWDGFVAGLLCYPKWLWDSWEWHVSDTVSQPFGLVLAESLTQLALWPSSLLSSGSNPCRLSGLPIKSLFPDPPLLFPRTLLKGSFQGKYFFFQSWIVNRFWHLRHKMCLSVFEKYCIITVFTLDDSSIRQNRESDTSGLSFPCSSQASV